MTDDNMMGRVCCCIPIRWFAMVVAFAFFLYGILNVAYLFMMQLFHLGQASPPHCVGSSCLAILSCDGLQEATMHVRMAILIIGGLLFGGYGVVGGLNSHPDELRWFASFLHGLIVLFGGIFFFDLSYSSICRRYTQNTIDMAVLWPTTNYPMREGFKFEIQVSQTYPVGWVDMTAGFNVFHLYCVIMAAAMFCFWYTASTVQVLAYYSDHGMFGLGANHDVGVWREKLLVQREIAQQFYDAKTMAIMTIEDVGWRADEDMAYSGVSYGAAERDVEHNAGGRVNYR